jgi:hypothetical protein
MKKLLLRFVLIVPVFLAISSCNIDPVVDDCSDGHINVTIDFKATVSAHYTDGTPVSGTVVRVLFYKIPCGEPAKGHMEYTYPLNSEGSYLAGPMTYNMYNRQDLIVAKLYINDGYNDLEFYHQADGADLQYNNGGTYTFPFILEDMPL